ncbi:hypothetical protein K7432_012670 [Basidiobolus ranarum]|uniref:Uncharacterized protein n=1 Tax=Basidiobolus ranarum TaxID=34480 RepID=A0ABR2VRX0_9FUNG
MTIDTKILNYDILRNKNFTGNKVDIWSSVVNLNCEALKSQNAKTMKFVGAIDRVGMSMLKQNFSTARRGALSGRQKMKAVDDGVPYIEKLSKDEILETTENCAY